MIPIDSRAIAEGLRGEIDTRTWVSFARVEKAFVKKDRLAVVVTAYFPEEITDVVCRYATPYCGNGFGLYFPLPKPGDEVIVYYPGGNPEMGPVAQPRLNNADFEVPDEFVANPGQVLLKAENGINVNIQADEINFNQGTLGVARLTDTVAIDPVLHLWLTQVQGILVASVGNVVSGAPLVDPELLIEKAGTISSASATVKAGG